MNFMQRFANYNSTDHNSSRAPSTTTTRGSESTGDHSSFASIMSLSSEQSQVAYQPDSSSIPFDDNDDDDNEEQENIITNNSTPSLVTPATNVKNNATYLQALGTANFSSRTMMTMIQFSMEGPLFYRTFALVGGALMMISSIIDWEQRIFHHSYVRGVISIHAFLLGMMICIVETRLLSSFLSYCPCLAGASYREGIEHQSDEAERMIFGDAKYMRFVWVRGGLYISSGALQLVFQWSLLDVFAGIFLCLVGVASIRTGQGIAYKLEFPRTAAFADSSANGGDDTRCFLNQMEFAKLMNDIGLKIEGSEIVIAFALIDTDGDSRISLQEFKMWLTGYLAKESDNYPQFIYL